MNGFNFTNRRTDSADQYKLVGSVFKNPLTINQINSHIRLTLIGTLYIGTLSASEYALDAREYEGSNASAYVDGLRIRFIPDKTNTTANLTVNIGVLGSIALTKADGTNFAVGELKPNQIYTFVYKAGVPNKFLQDSILTAYELEFDYYFYACMSIVQWIEKFIRKSIFSKTWLLLTTDFSSEKLIKRSPMFTLNSFKYLVAGVLTDVPTSIYQLVTSNNYSKISFLPNYNFPTDADDRQQNVQINFTTKMFDTVQEVDSAIKQAMVMILASLNQYRGDCIDSFSTAPFIADSQIPPQAQLLLRQYRIESIW